MKEVAFDICCEYERMVFTEVSEIVEVEVQTLKNIANFCSKKCQSEGLEAALSTQLVRIPETRPFVGPIEVCASCNSAVDMSDWHLTFIESDISAANHPNQIIDGIDLAVLCRNCAPFNFARGNVNIR